jgi:hypothetical protein
LLLTLRNLCRLLFPACLILLAGCSPAARSRFGAAMQGAAAGASAAPRSTSKVMIFGGEDHRTYLGCLNCSEYATDSIFNSYGSHGSRYATESVWNHYSEFGSAYSNEGACNPYANDPPVMVNSDGSFYGRLTLNVYHSQFGIGAKYHDWLEQTVCEK